MVALPETLAAWDRTDFEAVFTRELAAVDRDVLPLQAGLSRTQRAMDDPVSATLLHREADPDQLHLRAGLFYTGMDIGCSCADDPTPVEPEPEYCTVAVTIDRASGEATIELAD
ncbi:MAG: hypothetical protein ACQERG_04595 [Pseudomonadota bacterium]